MRNPATRFGWVVLAARAALAALVPWVPLACDDGGEEWSYEERPPDPAWGPGSNTLFDANKDIVTRYCSFYSTCVGWEEEDEEDCLWYLGWFHESCPTETERRLSCTLEEYTCELLLEEGSDLQRCTAEEHEMFDCLYQFD